MQNVPIVSRLDVERVVRREFPTSMHAQAFGILDGYGAVAGGGPPHRVQLAALKMARGSLPELRRWIALAAQDFRDVISPAEYPLDMANWARGSSVPEQERRQAFDADWKQYQEWLHRP